MKRNMKPTLPVVVLILAVTLGGFALAKGKRCDCQPKALSDQKSRRAASTDPLTSWA